MTPTVQFLYPQQALSMWDELAPLLSRDGTECAEGDVATLLKEGLCGVIAYYENGKLMLAMGLQFFVDGLAKNALIFGLGGAGLMRFRKTYWPYVVDWLRANKVKQIEVYGSPRMLKVYCAKFGFRPKQDRACLPL